ncbi:MAG: general secretion pathway protein GspK [Deltaproteobacteria bacterium]|nr:general secretion pathway protein GspK [Deltaproteobacteria bacterium]
MVLWVLILLSAIVTEFCFAMRTETNMVRNFKEQTEAHHIALAGLNRAILEVVRNEFSPEKKRLLEGDEPPENTSQRWRMNTDIPPVSFAQGFFKVQIKNEGGKIDLNTADESILKLMLDGFDIEEQEKSIIVDSILDWRDENDLHRMNGAEDAYYQSLSEPYKCKNADFDAIEELLMVRGVTPKLFYGGLNEMVTAFQDRGSRRGRIRRGQKGAEKSRICINAASKSILRSLPKMTDDLAQSILDFRKEADFKSLGEVTTLLGADVYQAISPYITLTPSPYYQIVSVGSITGSLARQGISAVVEVNQTLDKGYRVVQWNDRIMIEPLFAESGQQTTPEETK